LFVYSDYVMADGVCQRLDRRSFKTFSLMHSAITVARASWYVFNCILIVLILY
jgi:hypothetical protein